MNTTPAHGADSPAGNSQGFRIQDSGKSLWLMTAVLLASGFFVLRILAGSDDAPPVDDSAPRESTQLAPEPESGATEVHKLRPQTLDDSSHLGAYPWSPTSESLLAPAAHWDELAAPPAEHRSALEIEFTQDLELLR